MFRQSGIDKLLDKATSNLLMEPDWKTILQICDVIRQNDVQPKAALAAIKKRISATNPHTAMYAVQVLESAVKNCGSVVHDELTTATYCEELHNTVVTTPHEDVREKLLELMQAWTFAFRKIPKYSALSDTVATMKAEGFCFPTLQESDAMFSADSAPVWVDGEVCHRCRTQFSLVNRKHHCRACGQVFCGMCSSKLSTIPKFGIEKEVRVCDSCYDQINKPSAAVVKDPDMEEYLKSSLAQQSQAPPPRKTEEEIREEEEFQLALALSQSEAEAKEKEKYKGPAANNFVAKEKTSAASETHDASPIYDFASVPLDSEMARYLNRSYWEDRPTDNRSTSNSSSVGAPATPSAPATAPSIMAALDEKYQENGGAQNEIEEFMKTLRSQVEIFINRMKSNSSRGRSIANDSSVQTLFMNITAMHSRLLKYIQQHDDSRLHYERLQDKMTQVKDARAALDALREEHREKLRREAEEAERQRQMLMAHKLDIMRKKKQEYLQYQRQVALQRIQEQEREMHIRQEQQKQQYIMGPANYYLPSPAAAHHQQQGQFPPNQGHPQGHFGNFAYQQGPPGGGAGMPQQMMPGPHGQNVIQGQGQMQHYQQVNPPGPGMPRPNMDASMGPNMGQLPPHGQQALPPNLQGHMQNMGSHPQPQQQMQHLMGPHVQQGTQAGPHMPQGIPGGPHSQQQQQGPPLMMQAMNAQMGQPGGHMFQAPAPHGVPGAPQGAPGALQGMPVGPQGMPVPQGMPGASQGMSVASQGMSVAPQGMPGAPQNVPLAPQGLAVAPQGVPGASQGVPSSAPGAPPGSPQQVKNETEAKTEELITFD